MPCQACEAVLGTTVQLALQYAASEGYAPLREAIAAPASLERGPRPGAHHHRSQQALDLIARC